MKYFLVFALCTVAAIVLIHIVVRLFGLESKNVTLWVPIVIMYFCFYGLSNPFGSTKNEE